MARARIHKDASSSPQCPWFYTVEHDPRREDALDYGSVETFERAIGCVAWVLKEDAKEKK